MPKKIYLASGAPQNFDFLTNRFGKSFAFTDDYNEADLLIVDLANPVKPTWVPSGTMFVAGPCPPPFLLTALHGPEDEGIFNTIKNVFSVIGPVHKKQEDLEDALAWIQSMFPLTNVRNLGDPRLAEESKALVLQRMKSEAAR
jgi:hypothetical protein